MQRPRSLHQLLKTQSLRTLKRDPRRRWLANEPKKVRCSERQRDFQTKQCSEGHSAAERFNHPSPSRNLQALFVERSAPNLPTRPDAPFPSRDMLDQTPVSPWRPERWRDSRLPDVRALDRPGGRLGDRPGDRPGDRLRDFSGSDRRAMDANPRDSFACLIEAPGANGIALALTTT